MSVRLSPDGMYYWDGQQWVSTLSHDGRSRWDGTQWVPVQAQPGAPPSMSQPSAHAVREPTSWTRPLQLAVAAWYAIAAVYALTLPFWMGGVMSQAVNQSIQRQEQLNPPPTPLPPDFVSSMTGVMDVILWVAAVFGIAVCVFVVIGALNRWTWMYYVVLVLLGLSTISLPANAASAAFGSSMSSVSGFSLPASTYAFSLLSSAVSAALFVWMLVALVKRGPWAMRKVGAPNRDGPPLA